ncbi:hypothetical protein [Paractinoplanes hotanensis]|uniref:Uncharacterized protein n=1 Tax=Paractinoplanes hotanensis TaxID=2906497 RepID=A0ABT0Y1Z9_9ACTN|nr:hypothetical protein [Actinoplanes hotanensis]MCM4079384.1 hypothetical protein [Actinoplanes hotanensis]
MTETGWPLIPREVLPAPVPAAKRPAHPRPSPLHDAGRQLPIFGAGTTEPTPADLAGLLAGPGQLGRMGGTARVSVVVEGAWRVHVLVAELVVRGLVVNWRPVTADDPAAENVPVVEEDDDSAAENEPAVGDESSADAEPVVEADAVADEMAGDRSETAKMTDSAAERPEPVPVAPQFEVLTAYSRRLNGLAQAWPRAAAQLFLSGPRLRLWVAAAGGPVPNGYALGLDPAKDAAEIDAALVRAGLAGRLSDDRRQYLIMGKRRVARLSELVGERPEAAPAELWPGGAGA